MDEEARARVCLSCIHMSSVASDAFAVVWSDTLDVDRNCKMYASVAKHDVHDIFADQRKWYYVALRSRMTAASQHATMHRALFGYYDGRSHTTASVRQTPQMFVHIRMCVVLTPRRKWSIPAAARRSVCMLRGGDTRLHGLETSRRAASS